MKVPLLPLAVVAGCLSGISWADHDPITHDPDATAIPGMTFECSYHSSEIPDKSLKLVAVEGQQGCWSDSHSKELVQQYVRQAKIDSTMQTDQPVNCFPLTRSTDMEETTSDDDYTDGLIELLKESVAVETEAEKIHLQEEAYTAYGVLHWASVPSRLHSHQQCNFVYILESRPGAHSGALRRLAPIAGAGLFAAITTGSSKLRDYLFGSRYSAKDKNNGIWSYYGHWIADSKTLIATSVTVVLAALYARHRSVPAVSAAAPVVANVGESITTSIADLIETTTSSVVDAVAKKED